MLSFRRLSQATLWICVASGFSGFAAPGIAGAMRYEVAGPADIRPFDLEEHFRPSSVYHKDKETGQLLDANNQVVVVPEGSNEQNFTKAWNEAGTIVGVSFFGANDRVGFIYQNGSMTYTDPKVGRIEQAGFAINDSGQVVGGGYYGGSFLYDHGVKTSLGDIPGSEFNSTVATDINNSGVIVGRRESIWQPNSFAFVYENGKMDNLEQITSGLGGNSLNQALAITDDGWILASAWDKVKYFESKNIWLKPLANSDTSSTTDPESPPSSVIDTTDGGFWTSPTEIPGLNENNSSGTSPTGYSPPPVPVPEPATYMIWAGVATLLVLRARR